MNVIEVAKVKNSRYRCCCIDGCKCQSLYSMKVGCNILTLCDGHLKELYLGLERSDAKLINIKKVGV